MKISTTDFDTLFANLILSVTARIEKICNREFMLDTYTNELHDGSDLYGSGRTILIARNAPISSVASVQYKAGTNTTPNWTNFNADTYDVDEASGMIYFDSPLPQGRRNIRITYTAGWDGFDVSTSSLWTFNVTPTGTVNGSNGDFTLPEDASEILVYADGVRLTSDLVTFTADTDTFTVDASALPHTTIAVDYKASNAAAGSDPTLPGELVDLCERTVVYLYKKRDAEGKTGETFQESSIQWRDIMFSKDDMAIIREYKRGYNI